MIYYHLCKVHDLISSIILKDLKSPYIYPSIDPSRYEIRTEVDKRDGLKQIDR